MGSTVTIECPGCQAELNLSDPSKLGKKIKCSKCSTTFVAEAPDEAADEASAEPAGGKKRVRGKKGAEKKKDEKKGGGTGPLIAAIGVTVVVLIGVGLFLGGAFKSTKKNPQLHKPAAAAKNAAPASPAKLPPITPKESTFGLRWMPPGTEALLHFKLTQLWRAPALKWLATHKRTLEIVESIQKSTGISPFDIISVNTGFADAHAIVPMIVGQIAGISEPLMPPRSLVVVRLSNSVKSEKFRSADEYFRAAEHGGQEYFELISFKGMAVWFPDSMTVLIGPNAEITAAIDRGETAQQREDFLGAEHTTGFVMVLAPRDPNQLISPIEASIPSGVDEIKGYVKNACTTIVVNLKIDGGVNGEAAVTFSSIPAAENATRSLKSLIEEWQVEFDSFKKNVPEAISQVGTSFLRNMKVESRLRTIKLSFSVPNSQARFVEKLPSILLGVAETGTIPVNSVAAETGSPRADDKSPIPVKTSDPVAAESADGLPDGVTLTACVGESSFETESDGKKTRPYQIYLDLTGPGTQNICVAGMLSPQTMDLPSSGTLRQTRGKENQDATAIPVFFDAAKPKSGEPPGRLRMTLNIERAPKLETEISKFEGSFIYQSLANARHDPITITNAPRKAGKRVTETKLKAAGFNMVIGNVPVAKVNTDVLMLSWRTGFFIRNPEMDFGRGRALGFVPSLVQGELKLTLSPPDSAFFTGEEKLTFDLYRDVTQHEVKFKFSKVQLPIPIK